MGKSADAFRTISEVADWLETPAHVLRFWESKFPQIKPVKRAGGRRYYRPADMALIGGIKKLLHDDGMTIKGVQKILRDQGVKHVAALSQPIDGEMPQGTGDTIEATAAPSVTATDESATVLPFHRTPEPARETAQAAPEGPVARTDDEEPAEPPAADTPVPVQDGTTEEEAPDIDTADLEAGDAGAREEPAGTEPEPEDMPAAATDAPPAEEAPATLPAFLHRGEPAPKTAIPHTAPQHDPRPATASAARPGPPLDAADASPGRDPLRPARIDLPPDPADDSITAPPGLLAAVAARKGRPLAPDARSELRTLRDRLAALHARQRDIAGTTATD